MTGVPQYVSQLISPSYSPVRPSTGGIENTQRASKELSAAAFSLEEDATKSETMKVNTMLKENISRIAGETGNNPAALSQRLDEFKKGVAKNIQSPDLAEELDFRFATESQPYIDKAFNTQRENVNSDAQVSAQNNIQQAGIAARTVLPGLFSAIPEQRTAAGKSLQLQFHDIEKSANAQGVDGKYLLTPEQRLKAVNGAKDDLMQQAATMWLADQPDPTKALDQFNKQGLELTLPGENGEEVKFNVRDNLSNQALISFNNDAEKLIRTHHAAVGTEVNASIDLMKQQNELGLPVDSDKAAIALVKARSINDAQKVQEIETIVSTNAEVQQFVPKGVAVQQQQLAAAQQDAVRNADVTSVTRYGALKKAYDRRLAAVASDDALNYYSDTGITEPLQPLAFQQPETLGAQLADRKVRQGLITRLDGVTVPLMNSGEMNQLREMYNDAPVDKRMELLQGIVGQMDDADAQDIASRIAPKDAGMAATMSLVKDDPDMAGIVMLGTQREKLVPQTKVLSYMQERLSGAIDDPKQLATVATAVHAAYTELAFRDNNVDKEINEDTLSGIMDRMLGPVLTVGGKKTMSFKRPDNKWADNTDFHRTLESVKVAEFAGTPQGVPRFNGMNEISQEDWANIADDYQFKAVGDGVYSAIGPSGGTITNVQGQPYNFDLRQLSQRVNFRDSWFTRFGDVMTSPTALDYAARVQKGEMPLEKASQRHNQEVDMILEQDQALKNRFP